MYCKSINKLHLLTEIWNAPAHISKLWFVFLALRDDSGKIYDNISHIENLCKLTTDQFTDAYNFLFGIHENNNIQYLIYNSDENWFKINCMDKKEKDRIDLRPAWKEKSKEGFNAYVKMTKKAFIEITHDYSYMLDLKQFYPNHDIIKSIQNSFVLYWGTQKAWIRKRRQKVIDINWRETIRNTLKFHLVKRDTKEKDYEYDYLVEKATQQLKDN